MSRNWHFAPLPKPDGEEITSTNEWLGLGIGHRNRHAERRARSQRHIERERQREEAERQRDRERELAQERHHLEIERRQRERNREQQERDFQEAERRRRVTEWQAWAANKSQRFSNASEVSHQDRLGEAGRPAQDSRTPANGLYREPASDHGDDVPPPPYRRVDDNLPPPYQRQNHIRSNSAPPQYTSSGNQLPRP
ncbi:hypothetical protein ACLMJK_001725 [Lecanora helva]